MKEVTKDEFYKYVVSYPRELVKHVGTTCDPKMIVYFDGETAVARHPVDDAGNGYGWEIEGAQQNAD
ncbi:protein of unknown function [Burkholderia multivorans]